MTKSVFTSRYHRLRELLIQSRKDADLSQSQLARSLKKPQSYVSKYERGERRLDVIEFLDIAASIGADPVELVRSLNHSGANHDGKRRKRFS